MQLLKIKTFFTTNFLVLGMIICLLTACDREPTDATLEKNFYAHEEKFNLLIQMSKQDKNLARIAYQFTRTEKNYPQPASSTEFPQKRWGTYRQLFDALSIKGGLSHWETKENNCVSLLAYNQGLLGRGISKGYIHCEKPLPRSMDDGATYKNLRDNWYIWREMD